MAVMTKAQIRTQVAQLIDDPDMVRWTSTNLDLLITVVADLIWQQMLDSFDDLLSYSEPKAPSAAGVVPLSALTGRFYRMQQVTRTSDGLKLQAARFGESFPQPSYYFLGGSIYTVPIIATPATVTLIYSCLPLRFTDIATDATVVPEWPEGHEAALTLTSAAIALAKGDHESSLQMGHLADVALQALVAHVARRYPAALTNQYGRQLTFGNIAMAARGA